MAQGQHKCPSGSKGKSKVLPAPVAVPGRVKTVFLSSLWNLGMGHPGTWMAWDRVKSGQVGAGAKAAGADRARNKIEWPGRGERSKLGVYEQRVVGRIEHLTRLWNMGMIHLGTSIAWDRVK